MGLGVISIELGEEETRVDETPPRSTIAVSRFKVDMTFENLRCLDESRWLNDEVGFLPA